MNKLKLIILIALIFALFNLYLLFSLRPLSHVPLKENYFIAANYFNSELSLKYTIPQLRQLISTLSENSNVYVSIFENGSTDNTPVMLREFDRELAIPRTIITCNYSGSDSWETSDKVLTDLSKAVFPNFGDRRFRKMAALRNLPLLPLYTHEFPNDFPTKIIYLNDIFFEAQQILDLVNTREGDFDIACALDFYYTFYDTLVTRDVEGNWFSGYYPFVKHKDSLDKFLRGEPFEVYSCWNGVAILNAEPFLKHNATFRQRVYDLNSDKPCECVQSECFFICHDFRNLGYSKVYINPKVKVSYEWTYYSMHTFSVVSVLTDFFQSFSFEEYQDSPYNNTSDVVGCGMPPGWFPDRPVHYMKIDNNTCEIPFGKDLEWTARRHEFEHKYTERYDNSIKSVCLD